MTLKRAFWGLFVLMAVNYLIMVLWSLPQLMVEGVLPFDLRPAGYSPDDARAYLSGLSPEARAFYLGPQHWLDTAYPALLLLTLGVAFHRLFGRGMAWGATAVAGAAAGFDWLENAAVSGLLALDPGGVTDALVQAASRWTVLKSTAVPVALTLLMIGAGRKLWLRKRERT